MFKENFIRLCNAKGVSPNHVCKSIGLSNAAFTQWNEDSVPRRATLTKIADYFGVEPDVLLKKEVPILKEQSNAIFIENKTIYMIPLYESVSAGFGAYASDYIVDYVPCYVASKAEADESLCIVVSGDSMYPKIESGDTIQVHKQSSVDSGAIAVVLVDKTEALVKRVIYGNDWIELHSINPMYPPQRFEGKDVLRIEVVGLVKKVIKDV